MMSRLYDIERSGFKYFLKIPKLQSIHGKFSFLDTSLFLKDVDEEHDEWDDYWGTYQRNLYGPFFYDFLNPSQSDFVDRIESRFTVIALPKEATIYLDNYINYLEKKDPIKYHALEKSVISNNNNYKLIDVQIQNKDSITYLFNLEKGIFFSHLEDKLILSSLFFVFESESGSKLKLSYYSFVNTVNFLLSNSMNKIGNKLINKINSLL